MSEETKETKTKKVRKQSSKGRIVLMLPRKIYDRQVAKAEEIGLDVSTFIEHEMISEYRANAN